MNELIILKDAATEIGVEPGYLRLVIAKGKLHAEKFGGRDWWVRRRDLRAFDKERQPRGRPLAAEGAGDPEVERQRAYQREYRRKYRARQKERAEKASSKKRGGKK